MEDFRGAEAGIAFGDVARASAGGVANLRHELEITANRLSAREPKYLHPNLDGELVAIQVLIALY